MYFVSFKLCVWWYFRVKFWEEQGDKKVKLSDDH